MNQVSTSNSILDTAKQYLEQAQNSLLTLNEQKELLSSDYLLNFDQENRSLANRIRVVGEACRKLSIGIIGTVKAGKSSFLNALLFRGEPFLPKASTPMTATLTKLSYSETPEAVVHFYSPEDYSIIEQKAKQYEELLDNAYRTYIAELENEIRSTQTSAVKERLSRNPLQKQDAFPSKEEFERLNFGNTDSAKDLQAYKEIVQSVNRHPDILDHLGSQVPLDGDVRQKLHSYVSASGKFTPIVSFVEYRINNPALQGLEIIDTPGMNDPIVSRGKKTREFLSQCDVTILLSPCSQFMDAGVIENISRTLPNAGVEKILVVGSKLDSGVRNEKGGSFLEKYKKSKHSYLKQYENSLNAPAATEAARRIIAQLKESKPMFISSMCYSIRLKKRNGQALDEEEQNCLADLRKSYSDFEASEEQYLGGLSGIEMLRKELENIRNDKIRIIEQRDGNIIASARRNHLGILDDILADIQTRYTRLRDSDLAGLRKSIHDTRAVIDSSRKHLSAVFHATGIQAEKKIVGISANIQTRIAHNQELHVDKKTSTEHYSVKTGLFGWSRKHVTDTITTYEASTADVANNLMAFHGECVQLINEDFDYLFSDEQLSRNVKEIVLGAFDHAELEFRKEDILLPLSVVLAKIKLPKLNLSCNKYIDELNAAFPQGSAMNEDIHSLKNMQASLFVAICSDLSAQLKDCGIRIKKIMDEQAESFADEISNKFTSLLKDLSQQADNKEHYLALYEALPETVHQIRQQLKEIQ